MIKRVAGLAAAILIFSVVSWFYLLKEPVVFAPSWRAGQTWEVQVFSRTSGEQRQGFYHNAWKFRVTDKKNAGGETVFIISARENKKKAGIGYRLELTHPKLVLKKMSIYKDKKLDRVEKPKTVAFFLDPRSPSLLPLDFAPMPTFAVARADSKKSFKTGRSEIFAGVSWNATMTQEIVIDEPVRKLSILTKQNIASVGLVENVQVWEESRPWWSGASRFKDGIKESEAILVKW